MYNNS